MILSSIGIIASKAAAAGGYDADAQAFFTAAGLTNTTQKDAVNAMVLSLKSNSLWTKMLSIYPMVGGTADTHKFNLKNPANTDAAYRLSFNGSWSHTSNGAITNGGNTWADTFIQPSNSLLGQNDICLSYYVRNATNDGSLFSILGYGNAKKTGLLLMSRIASNEYKRYGRGSLDFTYSANSNTVVTGYSINIGCKYQTPASRSEFTSAGCSFASLGNGLNATEVAALNTIVQTYQIALSRNIY